MKKDEFAILNKTDLLGLIQSKQTPCYLYFQKILQDKIDCLKSTFDPSIQFLYSLKANPNTDILRTMASNEIGADVASSGELLAALNAGIPSTLIEFSGPGKTEDELRLALQHNIASINVESLEELTLLVNIAKQQGHKANVGIRVNTSQTFKTGLVMAGDTQFGVPVSSLYEYKSNWLRLLKQVNFTGIHNHVGSQVLDVNTIVDSITHTFMHAVFFEKEFGIRISKINFGGGWGIPYFPNQNVLELEGIQKWIQSIQNHNPDKALWHRIKPIFELGRFLVAECGLYVVQILYIKQAGQKTFAITNGGMHHNYLLAGGMGQVIRQNFEWEAISPNSNNTCPEYSLTITGKLCTPQDILIDNATCNQNLQPGDFIVFYNCGAYTLSASPRQFLSHPPANEYWIQS